MQPVERSAERPGQQVHIGMTPFASAQRTAATPGVADHVPRSTYRVTLPPSGAEARVKTTIRQGRSATNVFAEGPSGPDAGTSLQPTLESCVTPHGCWQVPPPTRTLPDDTLSEQEPRQRDTLHPLLSELQAGENAKAAAFNPAAAFLANAARTGAPCEAHRFIAHPARTAHTRTTDDSDNVEEEEEAEEEEDVHMTRGNAKASKRGDLKTVVGRAYNAEGAFHDPEMYSTNIIDFAATQPTSHTAVAAKALAAAIHSKPSHTMPHNVLRSRAAEVLPNSGPTGVNTNRYVFAGVNDPTNPIVPPSPAFRALSSELQSVLLQRTRDTRTRVAEVLEKRGTVQPPPLDPNVDDGQTAEDSEQQAVQFPQKTVPPNDGELDEGDDTAAQLFAAGHPMTLWMDAVARRRSEDLKGDSIDSGIALTAGVTAPDKKSSTHPVKQILAQREVKLEQLGSASSLLNNRTEQVQLRTYLGGVGLRVGDAVTQPQPPSQSAFTAQPERARMMRTFTDTPGVPCNAFGFDTRRLQMILESSGPEVREVFLEGADHIDVDTVAAFGRSCPKLQLAHLASMPQITNTALTEIAKGCPQLRYLSLSGCSQITGVGLGALLQSTRNIEVLGLASLPKLDFSAGIAFTRLHRHAALRALDLSFSANVTDAVLIAVAEYCPALESLDISGCGAITDVGISSIAASATALRVWKLQSCNGATPRGLSMIGLASKNLDVLSLSGCRGLDTASFVTIVCRCPQLRYASVAGCTAVNDGALSVVAQQCKRLVVLNLSSCTDVSLAGCMEMIHELSDLRRLVVSESSISNAEVVMLSSLREGCKIVRNQFRPQPPVVLRAYKMKEAPKKAPAKAPGKK